MEAAKLRTISKSLFSLSEEAWLDQSKWSQIKAAIVDLAKNVSSYIDQLDQQRAGVNTNHSLMTPVRSRLKQSHSLSSDLKLRSL